MFFGLYHLPLWGYILLTFVLIQITIAGVTLYLHRCQAHRALDLHPAVCHFFRLWLWLTTGMGTKSWAAIHRKHHAKCETEEDPHSPQILGLSTVLWQGAELYRREAADHETLERYGHGTPNDTLEKFYSKYSVQGVVATLILEMALFGVPGIAMWALQMMAIPFFAAGVVNGVGHFWGYRNFECPDKATNIFPIGIFIGGEELHNNHHTYATSAKLSVKWWEVDIGWLYIKILSFFGLAKVRRVYPKPDILRNKSGIDAESLKAIITNKIQVMTEYSKKVVLPVFHQEINKNMLAKSLENGLLRKVRDLIYREDSLIDEEEKESIESVLNFTPTLRVVYQFRLRLQEIWSQTTASQKELIESLHEWCKQAEATGIQSLKEFSEYLKGYRLKTA